MSRHPLEVQGAQSEKRYLQSRHQAVLGPLPTSIAFVGISTSGKSSQMIHIANLLFPVMDRVFLFSHSHRLDPSWTDLKEREARRKISRGEHPDTHPHTFTSLQKLDQIVQEQVSRVMEAKETNEKHIPQAMIILDDLLGDLAHNATLTALVTRGRHAGITLLASSQAYRSNGGLSTAMRKNFACWALGRMPHADWKTFEEEHAGTYVSREQLRALWARALAKPYGFLFYRPRSSDPENMFWGSLTERLVPT